MAGWTGREALLEIGCAKGEAEEYLSGRGFTSLTGVDIDRSAVLAATSRVKTARFVCADACALPFPDGTFDGIFSEAAFAVISDKDRAAAEYARVLRKGGCLLVDDFMLREEPAGASGGVRGIPMTHGVQTGERYRQVFERQGFRQIWEREVFSEFIRIALSLSKSFGVSPTQVGRTIVSSFGQDETVHDFFQNTKMSYCQMLFVKE